jgi:hypothetical protein
MPTDKDYQFLEFLIRQTVNRKLKWEATAEADQFITSFKGKYTAKVDKFKNTGKYTIRLEDDNEQDLLVIDDEETQGGQVKELYDLALRNSLDVDRVIDEIMKDVPAKQPGPITDEDIPF